MADKKAVTLEQLEIAKNYIDRKDAENIKSAEFVDDTLKFYTSKDKSGEAVAEFVLPEEMFLDDSKTELVSDFTWDITKYPKSTDPELDGKPVLVLAVKSVRTVRYSFVSLDSVIAKLVGEDTESASVSVDEDVISLDVKVSELSGNRIVIKDDGLYVGTVDSTPSWTVSTDDEVREMFTISSSGITLASMDIGSTVKILENGEPVDYLIVHKGLPSDMYDESCDGIWVLRETVLSKRAWDPQQKDEVSYSQSEIHSFLNNTFLNTIEKRTYASMKTVKIPYDTVRTKGKLEQQIGEDGLICRTFLLSKEEIGRSQYWLDGTLAYFNDGGYTTPRERRIAYDDLGNPQYWWMRSLNEYQEGGVYCVTSIGSDTQLYMKESNAVRPAFILPYDIAVDSNGFIVA